MSKVISVVGGDLRIVKLVEMLIEDGYTVYTYGLEYSEELINNSNIRAENIQRKLGKYGK